MPENQRRKYDRVVRCFMTVSKEEGLQGLYGGLTPHLMKSIPAAMMFFAAYEGLLGLAGIDT
jgi:solute carrier family 25, member 33/36